jgi:hypothetical protein
MTTHKITMQDVAGRKGTVEQIGPKMANIWFEGSDSVQVVTHGELLGMKPVYRRWEIMPGNSRFAPIAFSHESFDGAEDSPTRSLCGYCDSLSEVIGCIEEHIELFDLEPETEVEGVPMTIEKIAADLRRDDRLTAARILEGVAASLKVTTVDTDVVYLLAMMCGQKEELTVSLMSRLEEINASLQGG